MMTRVHAMYSLCLNKVVSYNWKRRKTGEELKAIGEEVCEFKNKVVECSSSVSTLRAYIFKFILLIYLMEDVTELGDIPVPETYAYEQFNVHTMRSYPGSYKRYAACIQKTVILT